MYVWCVQDPARDPGYWSSSRMLLEAAICLAQQKEEAKLLGQKLIHLPAMLAICTSQSPQESSTTACHNNCDIGMVKYGTT